MGPPQPKFTRSTKPKVFVTNGRDTPLRGIALVFTKVEPGAQITEQNISKVNHVIIAEFYSTMSNMFNRNVQVYFVNRNSII